MDPNLTPTSALLFPIMEDGSGNPFHTNDFTQGHFPGDLKDFNFDTGPQDFQYFPDQELTPPTSTRASLTGADEHSHRMAQRNNGSIAADSENNNLTAFGQEIERRFSHTRGNKQKPSPQYIDGFNGEQAGMTNNPIMGDLAYTCDNMNAQYALGTPMAPAYQHPETLTPETSMSDEVSPPEEAKPVKRRNRRRRPFPSEEQVVAKRENFLRRNRQAASLCREKKKGKVADLNEQHDIESARNVELRAEFDLLVEEVRTLGKSVAECSCGAEEVCGAAGAGMEER